VFSTEIFLKSRCLSDEVFLPAVDKKIAQQVSSMIQKGIRGELPRQMNTESINSPTVQAKANSDPLKELEKLGELKQKGLISEEEFRDLKADLLRKVREA
jgi:hypothetical protein